MKHLILALLLAGAPALAHDGEHHTPNPLPATMSVDTYLTDTVNHGPITCYGRIECQGYYNGEIEQGRMIVPNPTQHFYRYPYNEYVTVW